MLGIKALGESHKDNLKAKTSVKSMPSDRTSHQSRNTIDDQNGDRENCYLKERRDFKQKRYEDRRNKDQDKGERDLKFENKRKSSNFRGRTDRYENEGNRNRHRETYDRGQTENVEHRPPRSRPSSSSSTGSSDWVTKMEEDEVRRKVVLLDLKRYKDYVKKFEKEKENTEGENRNKPKMETDETVLVRRQKQIDYGKNTEAYDNYTLMVPVKTRVKGKHPVTPNKFQVVSRRSWESQIKNWRRSLHEFEESIPSRSKIARSQSSSEEKSDASSEVDAHMDVEISSLDTSLTSSLSECASVSLEGSRGQTPIEEMDVMSEDQNAPNEGHMEENDEDEVKSYHQNIKNGDKNDNEGENSTRITNGLILSNVTNIPCTNLPRDSTQVSFTKNITNNNISNTCPEEGVFLNPMISKFLVPKTPTGTPTEPDIIPVKQLSPPLFDASELLEALKRAGMSVPLVGTGTPTPPTSGRSLAAKFENMNSSGDVPSKPSKKGENLNKNEKENIFDKFDLDQCFKDDGFKMDVL